VHGKRTQFLEYRNYGNHKSLEKNPASFWKAMSKEDRRDYVMTFPAYLKDFIPDLWLTPNGLLKIPGKKDRVIFDASFLIHHDSQAYNTLVSNDDEPDIIFGQAWLRFLQNIYNLRITYPNSDILITDDNVVSTFRQVKIHPNVISAKAFADDTYLFVPTGATFGDKPSPPSFEPIAIARMAKATELDRLGAEGVPDFPEYIDAVQFAPEPDEDTVFVQARPDRFNKGVLDIDGKPLPTEYNMHVDDNLYAQVGITRMKQAMRCSIHALNIVMGGLHPDI
jgi:hypothetical protein